MDKNDPSYIAALEKMLQEKYGESSIMLPQENWTDQKEKEYLDQLKILDDKKEQETKEEIIEKDGFLIERKLFNKKNNNLCPKCSVYTKYVQDDLYLTKYGVCYRCFLLNESKYSKRNK